MNRLQRTPAQSTDRHQTRLVSISDEECDRWSAAFKPTRHMNLSDWIRDCVNRFLDNADAETHLSIAVMGGQRQAMEATARSQGMTVEDWAAATLTAALGNIVPFYTGRICDTEPIH
ncbi:MAG: hypothetical protein V4819_00945 [Verrucomicrobiota bacterium]